MLRTPVGRFRLLGLTEGVSFLLLLGVAMPLKYVAGLPEAVQVVGTVHGALFLLYVLAAVNLAILMRWSLTWLVGAFIAAVVPFGTFVLDARLRRGQEAA